MLDYMGCSERDSGAGVGGEGLEYNLPFNKTYIKLIERVNIKAVNTKPNHIM